MTDTPASPATPAPAMTPEAARLEIVRLESDPVLVSALTDKGSLAHADITARRNALYAAAYPEPGEDGAPVEAPTGEAAEPGAAPAPASAADLAFSLLSAYEGLPPGDEKTLAVRTSNRVHVGAALAELGATVAETESLGRQIAFMAERKIAFTPAEGEAAMRREWGADFDRNKATAEAALDYLGDDDLKAWLTATELANTPLVVRTLFTLGKRKGL